MNPPDRNPFSDDQLDRMLSSRFRDTTPEFDARWVEFKRHLRTPSPSRRAVPSWAAWLGVMSSGVTLAAILLAIHPWRPAPPHLNRLTVSPALAELFSMDDALAHATPLLDAENRDELLNLPATPHS
jgi:hypothetical protein